jgi:hypothetical protein
MSDGEMGNEVTTIKACPHCGSSDLDGPHFVDYVGDHLCPSWWIACEDCQCSMEVGGEEVTELLKAWNRRAGDGGMKDGEPVEVPGIEQTTYYHRLS